MASKVAAAPPAAKDPPQFQHDCTNCTFLGRFVNEHGRHCDLYHCDQDKMGPTVLARWSDLPSNYSSGIAFIPHIDAIREAAKRAAKLGLKLK